MPKYNLLIDTDADPDLEAGVQKVTDIYNDSVALPTVEQNISITAQNVALALQNVQITAQNVLIVAENLTRPLNDQLPLIPLLPILPLLALPVPLTVQEYLQHVIDIAVESYKLVAIRLEANVLAIKFEKADEATRQAAKDALAAVDVGG